MLCDLSRRDLVALSLAAAFGAATRSAVAGKTPVIETDVEVKTPDGTCDAAFIHPAQGSHAGVLIWHDSLGLRPAMRDLGKRIAMEGYSVLVPNLYYRAARSPVFDESFNYAQNPADREKKARMYFAIASDDDAREPHVKDQLKEAFAAADVRAEIEVYIAHSHSRRSSGPSRAR